MTKDRSIILTIREYENLLADSDYLHITSREIFRDFLKKEDFLYYKERVPSYFPLVALWGIEQADNLVGFIGIAEDNIEMLFVDHLYRGKGIGKQLITYAINEWYVTRVDVNEQNTQALGFYEHLGFHMVAKSDLDNEGKPYPILHLRL